LRRAGGAVEGFGPVGEQVEGLEDEADALAPQARERGVAELP
jgi:hypothetical protein